MSDKRAIIDLEKKFWDTMVSKDADTASRMITSTSILIGPQGVSAVNPGDFAKMMQGSKWRLDSYSLSDVQVTFPVKDTAVIGYKVRQKGDMDGKPYDMECADASTWTRNGDAWLCALHTETLVGSPFGADRS